MSERDLLQILEDVRRQDDRSPFLPMIQAEPADTTRCPDRIPRRVVLPAPLGPTRATAAPGSSLRSSGPSRNRGYRNSIARRSTSAGVVMSRRGRPGSERRRRVLPSRGPRSRSSPAAGGRTVTMSFRRLSDGVSDSRIGRGPEVHAGQTLRAGLFQGAQRSAPARGVALRVPARARRSVDASPTERSADLFHGLPAPHFDPRHRFDVELAPVAAPDAVVGEPQRRKALGEDEAPNRSVRADAKPFGPVP